VIGVSIITAIVCGGYGSVESDDDYNNGYESFDRFLSGVRNNKELVVSHLHLI
jgi:hypothetical protein